MNKTKRYLLLSSLFLCLSNVQADDVLTVGNVILPQSGEATLEISGTFETNFTQFQLEIELDEGLTLRLNDDGLPWAEMGDKSTDHTISPSTLSAHTYRFVGSSMNQKKLPSGGVLMRVMIVPDGELAVGTVLQGTVKNILLNEKTATGNVGHDFDDMPFTVTVSDKIVLDENSSVVPTATDEEVDILVKRTIKAGQWSTICLPFDMTEEQLTAAFGDDVQVAEFDTDEGYTKNDDGTLVVNFIGTDLADGLYANYPYIIKTSDDITEFEVTAQITPEEDDAVAEYTTGKGSKKRTVGTFTGTYHAGTVIPENCLFLSDNKFYYSVGKTKSKAFRAWFWLEDVLPDVAGASSRITMKFSDGSDTMGIWSVATESQQTDGCYNLQGQRIAEPRKGLYFKDGKKVIK